jgi:hypothetical protein
VLRVTYNFFFRLAEAPEEVEDLETIPALVSAARTPTAGVASALTTACRTFFAPPTAACMLVSTRPASCPVCAAGGVGLPTLRIWGGLQPCACHNGAIALAADFEGMLDTNSELADIRYQGAEVVVEVHAAMQCLPLHRQHFIPYGGGGNLQPPPCVSTLQTGFVIGSPAIAGQLLSMCKQPGATWQARCTGAACPADFCAAGQPCACCARHLKQRSS